MTRRRVAPAPPLAALPALALSGCRDVQSILSPIGPEADRVHLLSWILFAGSGAIFLAVLVLAALALIGTPQSRRWLATERLVIGGGIVFPVITLSVLLIYGFGVMRAGGTVAADGEPLRVEVVGEQWWWRVVYGDAGGERVETANELRIPTGRAVELSLTTADVIHSFWVPNLAGKVDMIPGRTNRLTLLADSPRVSRGQCAEYCGGAHALMSFFVIALPPEEFARWYEAARAPARDPQTEQERRGQALFLASGCGACHTVRGTPAAGTIAPDLTHVGSRRSLAAATLPNDAAALARWIRDSQHIKPENRMPPYGIFSEGELDALAAYLASLR